MIKIGDLVVPVTREWDKRRYKVTDIFVSEKSGEKLLQVAFIGSMGEPKSNLCEERLFEIAPEKQPENSKK